MNDLPEIYKNNKSKDPNIIPSSMPTSAKQFYQNAKLKKINEERKKIQQIENKYHKLNNFYKNVNKAKKAYGP